MQPGDLARITNPSFTFGDSQFIIDAWTHQRPVLILKESTIEYPGGKHDKTALIQLGKKTTWILKNDLTKYESK
jgi:hypothetical protein